MESFLPSSQSTIYKYKDTCTLYLWEKEGRFSFEYAPISSYLPIGRIAQSEDKSSLKLCVDGTDDVFWFERVEKNHWQYRKEDSPRMPWLPMDGQPPDGAIFEKQ